MLVTVSDASLGPLVGLKKQILPSCTLSDLRLLVTLVAAKDEGPSPDMAHDVLRQLCMSFPETSP
jgi:hypothetical protein